MADGQTNYAATLNVDDVKRKAAEAGKAFESMGNTAQKEGMRMDEAFKLMAKTVASFTAGFFSVSAVVGFTKQIINVRSEIQSLEVSFKTLLGDEEKAVKLMADIRKFAANTPMQMNDLAAGAKTLLAFNIEAERVMPILQALGDISMGDSQKFQSLTLAFSQMSSAGRLMGQDLMQMINAGFNPLAQISEKTGKSIGQLKEEMSAGKISVDMVTEAFMDATSEGGKFYGMLEQQSKGIQGSFSNVQGALQDMMNEIGEKLQEPVTDTLHGLQSLIQNYEKVGKVLATLVATYGSYKAAIMVTVAAEKVAQRVELQLGLAKLEGIAITRRQALATILQKDATLLLTKAQKLLNATMLKNPFVLAATAVVGLVSAYFLLRKRTDEAKLAQEQYDAVVKGQEESTQTRKDALDTIIQKIKDETATVYERAEAYKAFAEQFPDLFRQYKETGELTDEMKVKIDALIADQSKLNEEIEKQGTADLQNSLQALESEYTKIIRLREKWKNSNNGSAISAEAREYNEAWRQYQEQAKEAGFGNDDRAAVAYLKSQIDAQEKYLKERLDNIRNAEWAAKPITAKIEITQESLNYAEKELKDAKKKAEAKPWNPKVQLDLSMAEKQVQWLKSQLFAFQGEQASMKVRDLTAILSEIHQAEKVLTIARAAAKGNATDSNKKKVEEAQADLDKLKKEYELVTGKSYDQVVKSGKDRLKAQIDANNAFKDEEMAFAEWQKKQAKQAGFERTQADIDAREDGLEKTLMQINLDYEKQKFTIEENEKDMVERVRRYREAEWAKLNPQKKKEDNPYSVVGSVTAKDLGEDQKKQIEQQYRIAKEVKVKAVADANKNVLDEVRSYEERRLKIQEKFARKREEIEKAGGSKPHLDENKRQEDEALKALDEEIASRSDEYQAWLNTINSMTVRGLKNMLETSRKLLKEMENMPGVDEKTLAILRAKIATLEREIKTANLSPAQKDLEVWQKYGSEIGKLGDEISTLGDSIGGIVGEGLTALGGMVGGVVSAIDGIKQYAVVSTQTIADVSDAAAQAIRTAEQASVVLAIVSALIQALQKFDNFMNESGLGEKLHYGNAKVDEAKAHAEAQKERLEALEKAYDRLGKAIDKAYGRSKAELISEQEENLRQQIAELEQARKEEEEDKEPEKEKIKEYDNQIDERKEKLADLHDAEKAAIFGSDIQSAIESLADALVDAWGQGSSAAEAFKDFARQQTRDMLNNYVRDYIAKMTYADDLRKRLEDAMLDGNITDEEWNAINTYAEESGKKIEEALAPVIERIKAIEDEEERRGATKGIAQASQDSVDELNGRFTVIQGHTYALKESTSSIADSTARLLAVSNDILGTVRHIDTTTTDMHTLMGGMADEMNIMRRSLSHMELEGIRLKK